MFFYAYSVPARLLLVRILLQFPEGLKKEALNHAIQYRKEGHEVFLSASPCYGACDLAYAEAEAVKADKLIHFGHSQFIRENTPIPVEYVEYKKNLDMDKLSKIVSQLSAFKKISLATTVQYIHQLEDMKLILENFGHIVLIGKGTKTTYSGQILGCDGTAVSPDADAILFVGDGKFHPLAIESSLPAFVFNPNSGTLIQINDLIEKLRKKRNGTLAAALSAETFGILLSTKPGQSNLAFAEYVQNELLKRNKRAEILVAGELLPSSLNNFLAFDCYISTACPRLSDDGEAFGKPVLDAMLFSEYLKLTNQV